MTAAFELSSGFVSCGRKEGERVEKLDPFMYTLGRKRGASAGSTLRKGLTFTFFNPCS